MVPRSGSTATSAGMSIYRDLPISLFTYHTLQTPQQQQTAPSYEPSPAVIEQNDGFQYALSAAPNVLYQRYKQYGQVCTE